MKSLLIIVSCMLLATLLRGQMIVSDPGLMSIASQELGRLTQLNMELSATNQSIDLLVGYVGNPRVAVESIDDLSTFVTNVGRMGMPKYRVDVAAAAVRPGEAMERSENPYRRKVGSSVVVDGRKERRNLSLYEDGLRFEGSIGAARELLEANRAHQHTLLGRLATANDHFERAKNLSALLTASVEMQRLEALMAGADALGGNVARDAELARIEKQIGEDDRRRRRRESERFVAQNDNRDASMRRREMAERRRRELRTVEVKKSLLVETAPWAKEGRSP